MEPIGPLEPMETILEVSEMSSRATSADHSRTTSADSHKTETQSRIFENETFDVSRELSDSAIEAANEINILSSTQIKKPPYFLSKPSDREIGDGEKLFKWQLVNTLL